MRSAPSSRPARAISDRVRVPGSGTSRARGPIERDQLDRSVRAQHERAGSHELDLHDLGIAVERHAAAHRAIGAHADRT